MPLKVLVVDDNRDNVELVCQILEEHYELLRAYSGAEALELACSEQPHLILLDAQMPGMDGYQVLAKLQADERTRHILVMFLSARYRDEDRVIAGLELGAFDYITKPVSDQVLLAKIAAAARLKQAEDEVRQARAHLEQQVSERTTELARANEDLKIINRIVLTCSSVLDLGEILDRVMDQALAVTGLEGGTICFVQPDQSLDLAAHRATSAATIEDLTSHTIKIGDCLCGNCALEKKPLILWNRQEVLAYSSREATRNEQIHFHAAFPLVTSGRCVGVLCIFTTTDRKPSEHSLQLLETVCGPMALAIDNANLYQQSIRHGNTLEEKVAERTTELHQAQQRLQQLVDELNHANLRLQDVDRAKSMFIASMSHELRTPLNSIIGFSSILLKEMPGPLNFEQKKQLKMVMGSARHLLNLINDILDISKIESGELTIARENFSLLEALAQVQESLVPQAEKKGLYLTVKVSPEIDRIVSDSRRVRQILLNLVGNAVKFTEHGGVTVECTRRDQQLEIRVIDSGIGIREENLENLFLSFRQLDTGLARKYEGTGLGLFICKRLVKMLGGQIRVQSRFGEGSTFSFTLPLNQECDHG
jgi:signal transduction histidine kinase/DNA-binding response OmpR family regulator